MIALTMPQKRAKGAYIRKNTEPTKAVFREREWKENAPIGDEVRDACDHFLASHGLSGMRQVHHTRRAQKAEVRTPFLRRKQPPLECRTLRQAILASVKSSVLFFRSLGMIRGGAVEAASTEGWEDWILSDGQEDEPRKPYKKRTRKPQDEPQPHSA